MPETAPSPTGKAPPVSGPVAGPADLSVRTFRGDDEISPSSAEAMGEEAPQGKTDIRLTGLRIGPTKSQEGGHRESRHGSQVEGLSGGEVKGRSGGHHKSQSGCPGKGCGHRPFTGADPDRNQEEGANSIGTWSFGAISSTARLK